MRKLVVFAVVAVTIRVSGSGLPLSQTQQNALTTIDQIPTQDQLNTAFGSGSGSTAAATAIASIAADNATEVGIRLRAIRSLVSYCPPPGAMSNCPEYVALSAIIADDRYKMATTGSDVLVLRAAIEALGQLQGNDLDQLTPFLNHPSRDVRATTAFALRDLCNSGAVQPLRTRLQLEATGQVQLAISAALRVLGQAPCI
jgi:HEAT repeat protein